MPCVKHLVSLDLCRVGIDNHHRQPILPFFSFANNNKKESSDFALKRTEDIGWVVASNILTIIYTTT